ncbi:ketoacyl-ACP synthase III [bacterium CPR1]|nr:ketoacyl-ACP synthase III [bacterium CPR1]
MEFVSETPGQTASKQLQQPAGILGIGHAAPTRVVTNEQMEQLVETSAEWIESRTGIRERRLADENVCSSDLGLEAARQALSDARLRPDEIDLIIVATLTPDMLMPATACIIQEKLGARKAGAFDLAVACSGFVYALAVADQFVRTRAVRNVLVVGADTLSRVTNFQDRSTCVLFGDGAGAVVIGPVEEGSGILSFELGSDGSGGDLLIIPAGGGKKPGSVYELTRPECCIQMEGKPVYRFAVSAIGEAAVKALEKSGLTADEVTVFIPHQANLRIIEGAAKRLGVPMERVFVNVDRYGNTSNASIPIALWEARQEGRLKKGDVVVVVGFGGGLAWAAAVLRWS